MFLKRRHEAASIAAIMAREVIRLREKSRALDTTVCRCDAESGAFVKVSRCSIFKLT